MAKQQRLRSNVKIQSPFPETLWAVFSFLILFVFETLIWFGIVRDLCRINSFTLFPIQDKNVLLSSEPLQQREWADNNNNHNDHHFTSFGLESFWKNFSFQLFFSSCSKWKRDHWFSHWLPRRGWGKREQHSVSNGKYTKVIFYTSSINFDC